MGRIGPHLRVRLPCGRRRRQGAHANVFTDGVGCILVAGDQADLVRARCGVAMRRMLQAAAVGRSRGWIAKIPAPGRGLVPRDIGELRSEVVHRVQFRAELRQGLMCRYWASLHVLGSIFCNLQYKPKGGQKHHCGHAANYIVSNGNDALASAKDESIEICRKSIEMAEKREASLLEVIETLKKSLEQAEKREQALLEMLEALKKRLGQK